MYTSYVFQCINVRGWYNNLVSLLYKMEDETTQVSELASAQKLLSSSCDDSNDFCSIFNIRFSFPLQRSLY
jgi:hypothetical protein